VSGHLREVLDLVFRWIHVIAGIMWIGNSLLYNWLDRNLLPPKDGNPGVQGEISLLHSGGFYYIRKDLTGWDRSRPLHWFKWQAYTTWLTGAVLLAVVYYASGGALLMEGSGAELSPLQAAGIGFGLLAAAWLVYHFGLGELVSRTGWFGVALGFALIIATGYGLTQLFSGRAAFLHLGAMLGTLMAGNVFRIIVPSQQQLVAAVEAGEQPAKGPALLAKSRSIHNNYLTFPVVVLMVSSHFPGIYGHERNWLLLAALVLAGAAVRHVMNVRFTLPRWRPALAATVAASIGALYLLSAQPKRAATASAAPAAHAASFDDAFAVVQKRCTVCHSASPADRSLGVPPGGVAFDTPEQVRAHAQRILVRAVETQTMPPANKTWITAEERDVLRRWIAAGAK